jgi:hypothetical protein
MLLPSHLQYTNMKSRMYQTEIFLLLCVRETRSLIETEDA